MSSSVAKPATASKPGLGGFPPIAPSSQAILLEKLNARTSTPDSEALASSDDEGESRHPDLYQSAGPIQKPVRRASWLNDTSQQISRPRQSSFASSSMSPTTSHPSTPSVEAGASAWGSHSTPSIGMSRAPGAASFPWGTAIWNTERKEPPSRLSEVLPSPTSAMPPGAGGHSLFGTDASLMQASTAAREQGQNPQIPFAIPLHPTPKTYRSQSYSVGQLDPDTNAAAFGSSAMMGRSRPPHSGIQHRPSRPSMLSEMSSEGGLGKVKEDDDDCDENTAESPRTQQQSAESKTIELLARENAMLRQQQQYNNSRIRPRSSTAAAYGMGNGYSLRGAVPEESDYAIDELDESNESIDMTGKKGPGRRLSEFGPGPFRSPFSLENRKLENVKKGFWQSSLGFGGLGDIPQSRRHSFADVPTRQASISSLSESATTLEGSIPELPPGQEYGPTFPENPGFIIANPVAASYFTGGGSLQGVPHSLTHPPFNYPSPYGLHASFANRAPSPQRNVYGMSQPRHNQLLHIVLFKCARADVFYIQEGTGLTVKPGDLVIVEADRGTDLGTVARDNVDWQAAKELKEHYAEEQYKWLMMYSQNAATAQDGTGAGLMASSNGLQASAVGGMGPPAQHHMQEPSSGELKPKLIKRLAQSHEIHSLRDKEGNEAKAKRVCMQKVKEHNLNMEILDAEFQMDWKKLTFYYFADSYINFNSLVTDLFKIYKTRIWMSAINPASFASPTLGLQAPSGIGPGAVGVGRGSGNAERRQNQQQEHGAGGHAGGRNGFQGSFGQGFTGERSLGPASAYPGTGYPYSPFGTFPGSARAGNMPYVPGMMQNPDTYQSGFSPSSEFPVGRQFGTAQPGLSPHSQDLAGVGSQQDWVGAFQGLSLNTR